MRAAIVVIFSLFMAHYGWADSYRTTDLRTFIGDFSGYRTNQVLPQYIETAEVQKEDADASEEGDEPKESVNEPVEDLDVKKEQQEFSRAMLETQKKAKEQGEKESQYEINKFDQYLLFLAKMFVNNHKTCRTRKDCLKRDLKTLEIARKSQRNVSRETYYERGSSRYGYNYGRKKKERKKVTVRDKQILAALETMLEEIKRLPDQELFNISPLIFKEMSEAGWERWGLAADQSTIVQPLVRIRRIANIAEATFDDIAIYMLTKVEEAYARCDSRDRCANDAAKVLQSTVGELAKLRNKLDKKKESHQKLAERLADVSDKIDAMQATARTEEAQEIYDVIAKIIMPKADSLTEEQFLTELQKIGYKPHLETNHEYWYRVYEGKIRDRSKRYERKYEVVGAKAEAASVSPDKKLKGSGKKRSKGHGMLNTAKNKLTQQGLTMTQAFMQAMAGMIMGKMGVQMSGAPAKASNNRRRKSKRDDDDDEEDDFTGLGLGDRSSKSKYGSSYSRSKGYKRSRYSRY